jgi:hypothetical protein
VLLLLLENEKGEGFSRLYRSLLPFPCMIIQRTTTTTKELAWTVLTCHLTR